MIDNEHSISRFVDNSFRPFALFLIFVIFSFHFGRALWANGGFVPLTPTIRSIFPAYRMII